MQLDSRKYVSGNTGAIQFDLKAVNPTAVVDVDTRTPQQIIENIEAQGRIVAEALSRLDTLLQQGL